MSAIWGRYIVRKGEIACNKQFLLFSQSFPQPYSVSKCGIVWYGVKRQQNYSLVQTENVCRWTILHLCHKFLDDPNKKHLQKTKQM